uniref:Uncharacterized protein n=1 Tax=Amphora coffeiformis TaxID=265554 RepID=A0A7S3KYQ0_9STRA
MLSTRFPSLMNGWALGQSALDGSSRDLSVCMLYSLSPIPHSPGPSQLLFKDDAACTNEFSKVRVKSNNVPLSKEGGGEDETISITVSHASSTTDEMKNIHEFVLEDISENVILEIEFAQKDKVCHEKQKVEALCPHHDEDDAGGKNDDVDHGVDEPIDDKVTDAAKLPRETTNRHEPHLQHMEIVVEHTAEHDCCTSVLDENESMQDAVLNLPVLLVHPESGRYEILSMSVNEQQQRDDSSVASVVVAEVIRQVAQQDIFRRLDYDGVCNAKGILINHDLSKSCKEEQNVLLVAIPHNVSVETCCRMARHILRQAEMIALLEEEGFQASSWVAENRKITEKRSTRKRLGQSFVLNVANQHEEG